MKVIGITGGIGSGKTTICKLFECLHVPVFYADEVAKEIMRTDLDVQHDITTAFGKDAYLDGMLNRSFLASVVFNDAIKLSTLNSIVHPAVGRATQSWNEANASSTYGLKEAAILFESGSHRHVEKVINVWAPLELRIKRVMKRDGVERDEVLKRAKNQISEGLRLSLSDFVIENDGKRLITPQVMRIDRQIRSYIST